MKQIILLDLDGCISDDLWRQPFINLAHPEPNERWRRYHEHLIYDRFRNQELVFGHEHSIVVITARHEKYRALTHSWFDRHEIRVEDMLMRADEDFRPSLIVKRELLEKLLCDVDPFTIACAYDDRPDIIEMYHTYDLHAEVRAIHPHLDPRSLERT
jgi:hypothetical protein